MSTQPDSTPQTPAEAPDKGVVCDALVSPSSGAQTVSLAPNKYVRVIAPGIDITAKLTSEQVSKLVQFTLEMIAPPANTTLSHDRRREAP